MITKLKKNQVFVFGSNLNGAHAGGAALQAYKKFGAEMGVGEGMTGKSYAFPTLDKKMQPVSWRAFGKSVRSLYKTAIANPDKEFLLTKVGCGIAGLDEGMVRQQFEDAPKNITLPEEWKATYLWKFLRIGMKSEHGNHAWVTNHWYSIQGELNICNNGFHASKTPLQALGYVKGEILAKVEVRGQSVIEEDKECWSEMRVVEAYQWDKLDSVEFAIYAAELVIDIFEKYDSKDKRPREAIEAAKKYIEALKSGDSDAAYAAYAADAAARAAAYAAAYAAYAAYAADAAYAAARAAAYAAADAAYAAARAAYAAARAAAYAAYAAARKELTAKLDAWFMERVNSLKIV